MNSSKSPEFPPWGSVTAVTAEIFPNTKKQIKEKKTYVINTVTSCRKDNKVSPKNVKNVADEDKNESLKETKTESEVASNEMNH